MTSRAGLMAGSWLRRSVQSQCESVEHRSESVCVDDIPGRSQPPIAHYYDPSAHARRLVQEVYSEGLAPIEILASELQQMYRELVAELGWREHSWITVGHQVKLLIGGRKTYVTIRSPRGGSRRLRAYRFEGTSLPAAMAADSSPRLVSVA